MPFYANKKRDTSTHVVSLSLLAIFFCSQAAKHRLFLNIFLFGKLLEFLTTVPVWFLFHYEAVLEKPQSLLDSQVFLPSCFILSIRCLRMIWGGPHFQMGVRATVKIKNIVKWCKISGNIVEARVQKSMISTAM